MSKAQFIAIGVAVVIAGALGVWVWLSSATNFRFDGSQTTSGELSYDIAPTGDRSYVESTEFYDIKASYPDTTPLGQTVGKGADSAAVNAMESWISGQVRGFISMGDFDNLTEEDKQMIGFASGRKYTLEISYDRYESPETVSYVYSTYEDTFGAHPNGYFKTFVFDKRTGAEITLGDMLGGDWLERVSTISRQQIVAHLTEESGGEAPTLFEEGLAPEEGNFLNAYLDGNEIVILFDRYQVVAYAAGPQEVRIDRKDVADILKSEYR